MREAEIAALTDEFFEPTFTEESATVMLGSVVQTDDYGDRTVTHVRPDARSLARAELHAVPSPEDDGTSTIERVILVLRAPQMYSRATLEGMFGPARKVAGPQTPEGHQSFQIEFDIEHSMRGVVALRWWPMAGDHEMMGEPEGPDDFRVDEIEFRRAVLPEIDAVEELDESEISAMDRATVPPTANGATNSAANAGIDLDEAMDTGAWVGDLAWRILRPDFTLERARELFAADPSVGEGDGERIVIKPGDPRLEMALLRVEGDRVLEVRIDAANGGPLIVAVDAVSDRLNAQPVTQPGEITFQFESTRSRGSVSLVLAQVSLASGPIAAVNMIEVSREA